MMAFYAFSKNFILGITLIFALAITIPYVHTKIQNSFKNSKIPQKPILFSLSFVILVIASNLLPPELSEAKEEIVKEQTISKITKENTKKFKNYEYISGSLGKSFFCGSSEVGFEIFISDNYVFKVTNASRGSESTIETPTIELDKRALVIPIRSGIPIHRAIAYHPMYIPEYANREYYVLGSENYKAYYLANYDENGNDMQTYFSPGRYRLYRDGSKLGVYGHQHDYKWNLGIYKHPATATDATNIEPCSEIPNSKAEALIADRLSAFGNIMESRAKQLQDKFLEQENKAKF